MMLTTNCPSVDELRALTNGQLADEQSDELWGHVRECEECRSELETVADAEDSLIHALRDHDDHASFNDEPGCKLAVAKALGALSLASDSAADNEHDALPKMFGEYEIVRPLGRGGMGSVFLARHTKLGREVAIKILSSHRLADPRMRQRFEAEMRAVGKLSHPNIVTAHDARDVEGTAVLVTEYINGLDLGQLVTRTGPLAVADACEVIRQVAIALQYTSDQGFVHRDVKPSNIMLSTRGEVKLLDLGLARFQHGEESTEMTGTGQTMGTADYVAPQQVTDSRSVDVRADIYSLGCTLFKLLTGAAPFADPAHATAFAKMTAHVSKQPPSLAQRLPGSPAGLVKLVDSMLAKNPIQRPQAPIDVAQALTAYTQGSDLQRLSEHAATIQPALAPNSASAVPVTSVARPQSLLRRRIPMSLAIASGLLGMLLGFAMGIVITITKPDGSKMTLNVPDGSSIDIRDEQGSEPAVAESEVKPGWERGALRATPSAPDAFSTPAESSDMQQALLPSYAVAGLPDTATSVDVSRQLEGVWAMDPAHAGTKVPINSLVMAVEGDRVFAVLADGRDLAGSVRSQAGQWAGEWNVKMQLSDGTRQYDVSIVELSTSILKLHFPIEPDRRFQVVTMRRLGGIPRNLLDTRLMSSQVPHLTIALQRLSKILLEESGKNSRANKDLMVMPSSAEQTEIKTNLKQIGIAFHQFHETHKKFPGSANRREEGRDATWGYPISWRVALLPFLGQAELYEQYRFDEPWDSEHNRTLLDKMPDVYRGTPGPEGATQFQGFVGDQTALGSKTGEPLTSFTDGLSRTLLIADSGQRVPWTQPQDFVFVSSGDLEKLRLRAITRPGLNKTWETVYFPRPDFTYLMADGSVHTMAPVDPKKLAKLITRNGGEPVEP